MEFSEKLKKHRKEMGLSQEELSYQLNVSRQAVSKWENGQGFPETEKLLILSNLFGVSLDYLLKEDPAIDASDNEKGYYASRETVEGFLLEKARSARNIALAVAILIFSFCFAVIWDNGFGAALFMCAAALGVGMLVLNGFSAKRYREVETQPLVFDPTFFREFKESADARRKRHGIKIVFGIVILILCVVGVSIVEDVFFIDDERVSAIVPMISAIAVYMFIISGSALGAEKIILNNEEHMAKIEEGKKTNWIYGIFMPLAAMVFLMIGFRTSMWHPAWIIFPVTALLCQLVIEIINKIN